nr:MAG TPA: hypothetical protein [Caudoviricetes sp.]
MQTYKYFSCRKLNCNIEKYHIKNIFHFYSSRLKVNIYN